MSKVRYHRVLHGAFNVCTLWLSLKTLCLKGSMASLLRRCNAMVDVSYGILTSKPKKTLISDEGLRTETSYASVLRLNKSTS